MTGSSGQKRQSNPRQSDEEQPNATYLLEADGVRLRFAVLPQVELLVKLLGQVAMTALSKQRDFSMELHPSLKDILQQEREGNSSS